MQHQCTASHNWAHDSLIIIVCKSCGQKAGWRALMDGQHSSVCGTLFWGLLSFSWQVTRSVNPDVCFLKLHSETKPCVHCEHWNLSHKSFLLAFSKASPTVIVLWQIFTKELKSKLTQTSNCGPPVSFILLHIWRGVQDEGRFDEKAVHRWASPELLLGAYCWDLLPGCCDWKKKNPQQRWKKLWINK